MEFIGSGFTEEDVFFEFGSTCVGSLTAGEGTGEGLCWGSCRHPGQGNQAARVQNSAAVFGIFLCMAVHDYIGQI